MTLTKTRDELWEIVDLVVKEEVKDNEAIKTSGDGDIRITYHRITDHVHYHYEATLPMGLLQKLSTPTVRDIMKETIERLRGEAYS